MMAWLQRITSEKLFKRGAGRTFRIATMSVCSQVKPLLQFTIEGLSVFYVFKLLLVLLLLCLITHRNLRGMNDAQALASGHLALIILL